jgi:histidine triad (HIT) family protein
VPKVEVDHFSDVPEPYYSAIFQTAKKLAPAIEKATGCKRVCTTFLGYEIPHAHYHLIPTESELDMDHKKREQGNPEELKMMQEKILSFVMP